MAEIALTTDRIKIRQVLDEARSGKILIPEFQRDFIWKAEDIKELLTSIFGGYFIGTILLHENTLGKLEFQVKPLPAVKKPTREISDHDIVKIILDGQQRINSILYTVFAPSQPLAGNKYPHRFFLKLSKVWEGNILECVEYVTENKRTQRYKQIIQKELFSLKEEIDKNNLPEVKKKNILKAVEYISLANLSEDVIDEIYDLMREVFEKEKAQEIRKLLKRFLDYEIFYILIPQDTSIEDIVEIFERINKTSYKLSTIDLLLAKFYKEGLSKNELRNLLTPVINKHQTYKDFLTIEFLIKVIALLLDKEPKPSQLITLSANVFNEYKEILEKSLNKALMFLEKDLGTFGKNLAYSSMLLPLTAMFGYIEYLLEKDSSYYGFLKEYERNIFKYVKKWFFSNILLERYDEGASTKAYQDFKKFKDFIEKIKLIKNEQETTLEEILEENICSLLKIEKFNWSTLLAPKPKNSALLKGFTALLILNKVRDFETGEILNIDIATDEHIFPKNFFKERKKADILLNRTLSHIKTNRDRKNLQKPAKYFAQLERKIENKQELMNILKSHFINEKGFIALKDNDYKNFLLERMKEVIKFLKREDLIPKCFFQS